MRGGKSFSVYVGAFGGIVGVARGDIRLECRCLVWCDVIVMFLRRFSLGFMSFHLFDVVLV